MKKYCLNGVIMDFDYHSEYIDICGPKSLKGFLASLNDGEKAEIEINSPGGYVVSGLEMANAIKNSKAHLIAHVVGMAASMASVIACACDEIVMEEASFMMIHNPWGYVEGDASTMRKEANLLDQMKKVCISFYLSKFEKNQDELAFLMSEETWMTGNECRENGLRCSVVPAGEGMKMAAKISENGFAKMPEAAKKFLKVAALSEDEKAKVDAARAEAKAADVAAQEESFKARYQGASKKINELQDKIVSMEREHKADIEARDAAMASVQAKLDEAVAKLSAQTASDEFKGKFEEAEKALASAKSEIDTLKSEMSSLKAKLEESAQALVKKDEQLQHEMETRKLLTGGVLNVSDVVSEYDEKMSKAKTAKERDDLRKLKAAGKIK